jgi:hypothetical protein
VRRIYSARGKADRAVEKINVFDRRAEARLELNRFSAELGIEVEESDGFSYVWRERRADEYTTREEFLTIARALVEMKPKPGMGCLGSSSVGRPSTSAFLTRTNSRSSISFQAVDATSLL